MEHRHSCPSCLGRRPRVAIRRVSFFAFRVNTPLRAVNPEESPRLDHSKPKPADQRATAKYAGNYSARWAKSSKSGHVIRPHFTGQTTLYLRSSASAHSRPNGMDATEARSLAARENGHFSRNS